MAVRKVMPENALQSPMFIFFAEILERKVSDVKGRRIGSVYDIAFSTQELYPKATTLVVSSGVLIKRYASVPWDGLQEIRENTRLKCEESALSWSDQPPSLDFSLCRDILDKQVVDTNDRKVIRVNDVHLLAIEHEIRIAHVDVGLRGLLRRMGWLKFLGAIYRNEKLISWKYVQPLTVKTPQGRLRLTVAEKQLGKIPTVNLLEIILDVDIYQRVAVLRSIRLEDRIKLFSLLELEMQTEIFSLLNDSEILEIISRLPADQATDLLEYLPRQKVEEFLKSMESNTARKLSTLLGYTSDSAGGIMTTEFLALPEKMTAQSAIEQIKAKSSESPYQDVHHLCLLDDSGRLSGMTTFRRILLASPETPLSQISLGRPAYARLNDSLREIAFLMESYRLNVIPVVNNGREKALQGIITVDDVLRRLVPIAWRKRKSKSQLS